MSEAKIIKWLDGYDKALGIISKPEVLNFIGRFDKEKMGQLIENIPKKQKDCNLYTAILNGNLVLYLETSNKKGIALAPLIKRDEP